MGKHVLFSPSQRKEILATIASTPHGEKGKQIDILAKKHGMMPEGLRRKIGHWRAQNRKAAQKQAARERPLTRRCGSCKEDKPLKEFDLSGRNLATCRLCCKRKKGRQVVQRSKSADKAPRRLCKVCNELKALDQFELTQYQTVCIACTGLNQRPDPDLFIALRRRLTQFTPDEQDALIAEYRAILTTQSDRDYARFELAKKYGVSLGTLQSSVFRWENIRRHANAREAATGANSDLVTDWLFTMFEDLALAEDIQNSILAHRVRYKRGNHAS